MGWGLIKREGGEDWIVLDGENSIICKLMEVCNCVAYVGKPQTTLHY